jgi:DnaJ-like protein
MGDREAVCGDCGRVGAAAAGRCQDCGSDSLVWVAEGFVVAFPPGSRRCSGCGLSDRPLELRGWVRLVGLLVWQRERRLAAYVCRDCARRETTASLLVTSLLGWWSILGFLFFAPRATFHNWRACFTYPRWPGSWGALPAVELAEAAFKRTQLPLARLSPRERELVTGARLLYERLGARRDADIEELRGAFRARAKRVHPDTASASAEANEEMTRLNEAWQILSSERLRAAYDWLERDRVPDR